MKPVTIKYRDSKGNVLTVKATSCSGEVPAGSNQFYCNFYMEQPGETRPAFVAKVWEKRLLPGYLEIYHKLFGRPWKQKLRDMDKITLSEYRDWENELSYPKDTEQVWQINYQRGDMWVVQCTDRTILHVMNNKDVVRRGKFEDAIKKLFSGKKIRLMIPTTTVVEL